MDLQEYFENSKGFGVLATADSDGNVNAAVYSRPHVMDDGTVAFIMCDRLSHRNLQSNPHAAFLFHQEGPGYTGKRLHLTKVGEETDREKIDSLRRRRKGAGHEEPERFLVTFRVDKVRPLIGDAKEA
jgi:hypothetical protein